MSLRTPTIKELKTELISVMDYFPPAQPHTDSAGNIVRPRAATTQSDEVRKAMTANMFVQLLETIGNRTPSDIETSALILKEINELLEEYESVIGPMINLVSGEGSLIAVVRQEVAELTRNSFSGLDIPTNIEETPTRLRDAILSPFMPTARLASITGENGGNSEQRLAVENLVRTIWGNFDDGYTEAASPNMVRNFESNLSEFYFPFKYMTVLGDYLAQVKATAQVFPGEFGESRSVSAQSAIVKKAVRSEEIGIIKPLMFDFTTSAAKSIILISGGTRTGSALTSRFVYTDQGYERVFRDIAGSRGDLARGTTNKESMESWLNKPQNVLNTKAVAALRDGFLSDTELAEELGLESSNLDPLQSPQYVEFTEAVNTERQDIFNSIREIILASEFSSGMAGDFVPGVSPESSIRGGTAFRNCNFVGIKEGLGGALGHQNCISLAGLFANNLATILDRFQGAQRMFGEEWHITSVREISKYVLGILTGRSTPRSTFIDPITGVVTAVDNADPSVEENLRRIERITQSLADLRADRATVLFASAALERSSSAIGDINEFFNDSNTAGGISIRNLNFVEDSTDSHMGYSSIVVQLVQGLIATGVTSFESVERILLPGHVIVSGDIDSWRNAYSLRIHIEGGGFFEFAPATDGAQSAMRTRMSQFIKAETHRASIILLDRYASINGQLSDLNEQIEDLEEEVGEVEINNVEFIIASLINNFPFSDTLSLGEGINSPGRVARLLASPQYASGVVGLGEDSTVQVNQVDLLDPDYESRPEDVEIPSESGFLTAMNSVLTELILDCTSRIQSMPVELERVDILNYAYAYFMTAGAFARDGLIVEVDPDLTEDVRGFSNKILTPRRTIGIFVSNDDELISAAALSPRFQRNYANAIGLGDAAPTGQVVNPYQDSLDYVQSLSDLLTQSLAPGFAAASEALLSNVEALRRAFARSIAIGGSDTTVPLGILDILLEANDFRDFAARARVFIREKGLVPIMLLSTNNVSSSLALLQFALYALTQSPITKLDTFSAGASEVPFNKVCAVGVHKNLERLIEEIIPSADVERIKRDFVKIQLMERQLDPSPSGIDSLLADSDEYLEYGSKYLQSTPSFGQPPGGFHFFLGLEQDYKFLTENFSPSNPVIKVTKDIVSPVLPRREFELNLSNGTLNESFRIDDVEPEIREGIITFIRSEALKIYYYYMTGLIFDPIFAPDPERDDSIITRNLISANPITRLRALLDLVSSSDINQFKDIVLTPFISDNDSIEEFSAKIRFLT